MGHYGQRRKLLSHVIYTRYRLAGGYHILFPSLRHCCLFTHSIGLNGYAIHS